MCVKMIRLISSLLVFSYVSTQEYFEDLHTQQSVPKLSAIPKKFELRTPNVRTQFDRYSKMIEHLVGTDNTTITYKVKVIVNEPKSKDTMFQKVMKKTNAKKYNVPLKKTSMKLSSLETLLRKMAEETNLNMKNHEVFYAPDSATTKHRFITTRAPLTKYKPIKSSLHSYSKIVKPVKNKVITVTK